MGNLPSPVAGLGTIPIPGDDTRLLPAEHYALLRAALDATANISRVSGRSWIPVFTHQDVSPGTRLGCLNDLLRLIAPGRRMPDE
jgi:hypothetical protein